MKINLPKIYSQNDPAWRGKTLGTKGTIGAYGCLISDIAMICQYYGKDETPETLNEKLKANNGYAEGNLYVWGALPRIYPDIKYQGLTSTPDPLTTQQMDFIRGRVNSGYPVLVEIDTIPTTAKLDEHWVVAVDYDGDDFIVADPWDGAVKRITSWGEKPNKIIYAYAYYIGKPIQVQPDPLQECLKAHKEAVDSANRKDEEIKDLKGQIKNFKEADEQSRKQLNLQQDEIDGLRKEKNTLEKKLELFQTETDTKLAKKDLDCQSKVDSVTTRLSKDFELKEQDYKKKISDLEAQLKQKEVVKVVKPEYKTFKDKLLATIQLWF